MIVSNFFRRLQAELEAAGRHADAYCLERLFVAGRNAQENLAIALALEPDRGEELREIVQNVHAYLGHASATDPRYQEVQWLADGEPVTLAQAHAALEKLGPGWRIEKAEEISPAVGAGSYWTSTQESDLTIWVEVACGFIMQLYEKGNSERPVYCFARAVKDKTQGGES